ncbi:MAG: hypothetical protein HY901_09995 [Deltaproteobacteria bacterium]|nr:hypothetical protein [Deltaproteobacteria bacterium]
MPDDHGPVSARDLKPARLDIGALFPVIVPKGYLTDHHVLHPLLDGLEVALMQDLKGVASYVRSVELTGAKLAPKAAHARALYNLAALAQRGEVKAGLLPGPDDSSGAPQRLLLWTDHWLAAACLLLPGVTEMAREHLQTKSVCAMVPHRETLVLFPQADEHTRAKTRLFLLQREQYGRKAICSRVLKMNGGSRPYYEAPVVGYAAGRAPDTLVTTASGKTSVLDIHFSAELRGVWSPDPEDASEVARSLELVQRDGPGRLMTSVWQLNEDAKDRREPLRFMIEFRRKAAGELSQRTAKLTDVIYGEDKGLHWGGFDSVDPHSGTISRTRVYAPERRIVSLMYWAEASEGATPAVWSRAEAALGGVRVY